MLAVHFGAGNIGRGFIGQLLREAGYEVCFVDVNQELVEEINARREYTILLAEDNQTAVTIQGVRAIHGTDETKVAEAIAQADLVTTAVGPSILKFIAPVIAKGIELRAATNPASLNVIACENMIGGSTQLRSLVYETLSEEAQKFADQQVGFPDAAVDRIVPLQSHDDKLLVMVEPFYEWVVNRSQFVGAVPEIRGVTFVDDLNPYIERKLFTVNTGHALIAYLGYYFGYETIDQALQDEHVLHVSRQALEESGELLIAKHGFDRQQHTAYIEKILSRFQNPHISDQVTRVGRSPIRKLSPNDRLIGPAKQALDYSIQPVHLATGIAAALQFNNQEDPEAVEISNSIKEIGMEATIQKYTGVNTESPLFTLILQQLEALQASK